MLQYLWQIIETYGSVSYEIAFDIQDTIDFFLCQTEIEITHDHKVTLKKY